MFNIYIHTYTYIHKILCGLDLREIYFNMGYKATCKMEQGGFAHLSKSEMLIFNKSAMILHSFGCGHCYAGGVLPGK